MNRRKVLVTGGVHGDESTGVRVVRGLQRKSLPNVAGLVVHPEAVKRKKRFLETDINRSFAAGTRISLEEQLAARVKKKIDGCGLIIDLHNTKAPGTTCAITVSEPNNLQIAVAKHFGFDKLVVMPPSGSLIACRPRQAVAMEVARNDMQKFSPSYMTEKIKELSSMASSGKRRVIIYKYAGKVVRKTLLARKVDLRNLRNFRYLDADTKQKLKLAANVKYLPIFFKRDRKEETAFTLIYETGQLK